MNVIRVTKLNDDGTVQFDGMLGPNEVKYLLEQGLNFVMQAGVENIEGMFEDDDDEEDDDEVESIVLPGNDTVQ